MIMESLAAIWAFIIQHWPFIAFAFIGTVANQFLKASLFTKKRAHKKGKAQWLFWWGWKALPLYPIIVGGIVGIIWLNPEGADPAWPRVASFFYFAVAGALSISGYQIIKGLAKKRGYDLPDLADLTGQENEEIVP